MAGPLSWWPNRKSGIGVRACSKLPRAHRVPPWSTTPPIAVEVLVDPEVLAKMRLVLRRVVLVVAHPDEMPNAEKTLASLDDEKLAKVAIEAIANVERIRAAFDATQTELKSFRKEMQRLREENRIDERALIEAQKAVKERDDIAAKLKELQKQVDPEKQQLELMYAIDEATARLKEESVALRRELGQRQTEVEQLRASKKRLRDALERLAGKD